MHEEMLQILMLLVRDRGDGWYELEVPGKETGLLIKAHNTDGKWILDGYGSWNV